MPFFHENNVAVADVGDVGKVDVLEYLAALAIGTTIDNQAGLSIKRFVRTLRPIRSGVVKINGKEYEAEA